jgi:hypothetical protein
LARDEFRLYTLSEILHQVFTIYRQNFLPLIRILSTILVPITLLHIASFLIMGQDGGYLFYLQELPGNEIIRSIGLSLRTLIIPISFILLQCFAFSAMTRVAADAHNSIAVKRESISYPNWKASLKLFLADIGYGILMVVSLAWSLIPCIGWVSGPGIFIFIILILIPLGIPVFVLENQGLIASVKRTWKLARQRFLWLTGFMFLLYLMYLITVVGTSQLAGFTVRLVTDIRLDKFSGILLETSIETLVALILNLLYLPMMIIAITLVYYDLCMRSEQPEPMQEVKEEKSDAVPAETISQSEKPAPKVLVLPKEIPFFIFLSFLGILLYFLLLVSLNALLPLFSAYPSSL